MLAKSALFENSQNNQMNHDDKSNDSDSNDKNIRWLYKYSKHCFSSQDDKRMDDNGSDGNDSSNLSIDSNDECVR